MSRVYEDTASMRSPAGTIVRFIHGCPRCGECPLFLLGKNVAESIVRFDEWSKAHVATKHPQDWDSLITALAEIAEIEANE